jgi:putative Holliday junction resolvase
VLATPLATVPRGPGWLDAVSALVSEHQPIEVIVGLPVSLSGRAGQAVALARRFAAELAARIAPVPVRLVDERFTTVQAHAVLRGGGRDARARRSVVDQAAAALLLQTALDAERSTGHPAGELVRSAGGGGT